MAVMRDFTSGDDRYTVTVDDTYSLRFLGGDDWLRVLAGDVTAAMGVGDDYARVDAGKAKIYGGENDDRFDLFGGSYVADGGDGADRFNLYGGFGAIKGGAGNDRFDIRWDGLRLGLTGGDGDDLFTANGCSFAGTVDGGAGNDRFLDFQNSSYLRGGLGNDVYRVDPETGAHIIEEANEGTDTILLRGLGSWTMGANIENLTAVSRLSNEVTGNGLDNIIRMNAGSDIVNAGDGNDIVDGRAGNDVISDGNGDDRLIGGRGIDVFYGGAGSDTYVFDKGHSPNTPESPFYYEGSYEGASVDNDTIFDFSTADFIDVSSIDANIDVDGIQHFNVVFGTGKATGTLYVTGGDNGHYEITGFINAGASADITLTVHMESGTLLTSNFITGG